MNLKSLVSQGVIFGALAMGTLGLGAVPAYAQPAGQPGYTQDHPNRPHDDDDDWGDHDGRRNNGNWRGNDNWRDHDQDWRDDRSWRDDRREWRDNPWHYDQRPPWGWAPPPRAEWRGPLPDRWGPPPRAFDYWGHRVQPIWDDGFRTWGFWLFGIWIPLASIG
ncbi:hypothetical protein [Mycobacteroides salmoniphilum]|uniref:hypothetical protein n=1 Tax=Mycobacteroides salmoniphilum TaxID=404941 RepID=UPI0009947630|nr:hypothetical protein [Mycobacteroides salmoniphilum]